jgi:hypothetical protein
MSNPVYRKIFLLILFTAFIVHAQQDNYDTTVLICSSGTVYHTNVNCRALNNCKSDYQRLDLNLIKGISDLDKRYSKKCGWKDCKIRNIPELHSKDSKENIHICISGKVYHTNENCEALNGCKNSLHELSLSTLRLIPVLSSKFAQKCGWSDCNASINFKKNTGIERNAQEKTSNNTIQHSNRTTSNTTKKKETERDNLIINQNLSNDTSDELKESANSTIQNLNISSSKNKKEEIESNNPISKPTTGVVDIEIKSTPREMYKNNSHNLTNNSLLLYFFILFVLVVLFLFYRKFHQISNKLDDSNSFLKNLRNDLNQSAITFKSIKNEAHYGFLLEKLNYAEKSIFITSGWVSNKVVDIEFCKLLKRKIDEGVEITLIYGYRFKGQHRNSNPKSISLLERVQKVSNGLMTIKTGTSKKGNHSKCLIIDNEIVAIGSYNWLSTGKTSNNLEESIVVMDKEFASKQIQFYKNL